MVRTALQAKVSLRQRATEPIMISDCDCRTGNRQETNEVFCADNIQRVCPSLIGDPPHRQIALVRFNYPLRRPPPVGGPPLVWRGAIPSLYHQHLYVADVALAESALAIRQVELPHAQKARIEAEPAHFVEAPEKALSPGPQCEGVVQPDVFQVICSRVQRAMERSISDTDASSAPGKMYFLIQSLWAR